MEYGALRPDGYMPRIVDEQISRKLDLFGAVEIAGTMWCGETARFDKANDVYVIPVTALGK